MRGCAFRRRNWLGSRACVGGRLVGTSPAASARPGAHTLLSCLSAPTVMGYAVKSLAKMTPEEVGSLENAASLVSEHDYNQYCAVEICRASQDRCTSGDVMVGGFPSDQMWRRFTRAAALVRAPTILIRIRHFSRSPRSSPRVSLRYCAIH